MISCLHEFKLIFVGCGFLLSRFETDRLFISVDFEATIFYFKEKFDHPELCSEICICVFKGLEMSQLHWFLHLCLEGH